MLGSSGMVGAAGKEGALRGSCAAALVFVRVSEHDLSPSLYKGSFVVDFFP